MKAWYEDKESFLNALAGLLGRLARFLLECSGRLYAEIGRADAAHGMRRAALAVPRPELVVGEPAARESHAGQASPEDLEGWPLPASSSSRPDMRLE